MERVDEKIPETVQTKLDQIETERILERMFNSNDMNCLSTNVDQERVAHIRNFMVDYIHDKVNVVIPLTMAEYSVVLEVCKNRYHRLLGEKEAIFQMAYDKALADIKNEKSKREQRLKVLTLFAVYNVITSCWIYNKWHFAGSIHYVKKGALQAKCYECD